MHNEWEIEWNSSMLKHGRDLGTVDFLIRKGANTSDINYVLFNTSDDSWEPLFKAVAERDNSHPDIVRKNVDMTMSRDYQPAVMRNIAGSDVPIRSGKDIRRLAGAERAAQSYDKVQSGQGGAMDYARVGDYGGAFKRVLPTLAGAGAGFMAAGPVGAAAGAALARPGFRDRMKETYRNIMQGNSPRDYFNFLRPAIGEDDNRSTANALSRQARDAAEGGDAKLQANLRMARQSGDQDAIDAAEEAIRRNQNDINNYTTGIANRTEGIRNITAEMAGNTPTGAARDPAVDAVVEQVNQRADEEPDEFPDPDEFREPDEFPEPDEPNEPAPPAVAPRRVDGGGMDPSEQAMRAMFSRVNNEKGTGYAGGKSMDKAIETAMKSGVDLSDTSLKITDAIIDSLGLRNNQIGNAIKQRLMADPRYQAAVQSGDTEAVKEVAEDVVDQFPDAVPDEEEEDNFPDAVPDEEEVVDRKPKLVGMSEDKHEASWDLLLKGLNIR